MKYRPNMSEAELAQLMAECDAINQAYDEVQAEKYATTDEDAEDEMALLHRAALSRGQP